MYSSFLLEKYCQKLELPCSHHINKDSTVRGSTFSALYYSSSTAQSCISFSPAAFPTVGVVFRTNIKKAECLKLAMTMSTAMDFHSQIASIMEVLANAAVAEICKVVDDGYAVVHLEMSRSQKENEFLRRKIKLLELQIARYRAERAKGAEGSSSSRFPGVRLLTRQNRDSLAAGPSLQGRTRFLNRGPGAQQSVQKTQPINLDQDPDQEVVTTTKTESAEPEEDGELLIVKVEGAMETRTTNHAMPVDACMSSRGDADTAASKDASDGQPAGRHSETEGHGCLKNMSSPQSKEEKMDEVQGGTPEKHTPSQTLLEWQESSETEDLKRPSCSTYTPETVAGNSSFSQIRTNAASSFPAVSKRPQCDMDQVSPASKLDIVVINSLPSAAEDTSGGALLSGRRGDDGAEDVTSLMGQGNTTVRSQYQPLLCIQINEPPSDVMFEGNAAYSNHISTFNNPPVAMGTVDSQQQQTKHSWSGVRQMDNAHFSSQNHLYQASSSHNQESGSAQSQQQPPCLPYACTFCSRRYAHQCQLRIHERVHTGEKPYQCVQCGKSFGQVCSLKRHQMVHTGERPFPCPHCGKQFSTSTNLKVHQSVHTGEKRFHCSKCGKNFSFLSNLIRHQALHTAKGRMASSVDFHAQLASIMEVLANAAVAEICQLVDDGFASLRLEISRSQRENLALKSRLRLMEVRSGEHSHRELVVSCTGKGHKNVRPQKGKGHQCPHTVEPVEPEVVVIKKERLEEELTGCSVLEDHQTDPNSSIGPPSPRLAAGSDRPLSVEAEIPRVSVSGRYEKQDFGRPEAPQQEEKEGVAEAGTLGPYSHPADQSHRAAPRGSGPNGAGEMTKGEDKHIVDPSDSLSAESSSSTGPDVETALIKTLDSELSLTNTGVNGLCGAAADWRGEASTAVQLEAEPSWTQNPFVSVIRNECLSNSRLTNSQHTESEPAELDTRSLDSSSFDDLFCSPEVARSLTAPHKHSTDGVTGMEEPLSSSSFPFLSSFGNSSVSDSLTVSSFSNASSDSRSRSFPSSTERAFSCQQCGRLFSTSRDLVVHQRSHAGERIYHCHLCKKPFVHPHQLKTHQRVHTGEKPFSCAQCGKRFSQSSHIKRHMSVHTGEKRYSCSLCGKRFSQACSLKVHQAVHTGERPYSCTKCGKSFSVLGNLVRHQSVHIGK
ncbi:uncharacterized protein LOC122871355 [Siniperca chuatsi]|uniref:uncharacterized protein LOC122871355 n=1 Tax=Siniperca chuatsi TaxID=119488 RepID=UPI001CE0E0CD|nr:uncharacterized protein LOC122871355 [Siniperca chuatsi]